VTQVQFPAADQVPLALRSAGATQGHSAPRPAWLLPLSIAYLALPTLIFVLAWTRPVVALVAGVACLAVTVSAVRESRCVAHTPVPRSATVTIWATAATTGVLSGAGGVAPQTWDWLKHNALLRDLVVEPWPVVYEVEGGDTFGLTYYIGYHLPAAAVGKVGGWEAANAALLTWTVLGLVLALTWFTVLVGPRVRHWMIVGFVMFSGLDIVGRLVLGPLLGTPDPVLPSNQLDWWAVVGKYPNHLTSVMWAPHHAIAAWIGAGVVLAMARQRTLRWVVPAIAFSGLISPFVAIGLVPLTLYAVVARGPENALDRLRCMATPQSALATVATLPVIAYFAGRVATLPAPYADTVISGFAITNPIGPFGPGRALLAYGLLVVLEVLVFVVLVRRTPVMRHAQSRLLLVVITTALVIFPLYRYGAWSDLALRAVVPSMFALAVLVSRAVLTMPRSSTTRKAILLVLAVGLMAPLSEAARALTDNHANDNIVESHVDDGDIERTSGIVDLSGSVYLDLPRFVAQHVAPTSSIFFVHIADGP
jgi:hypothetical protein